MNSLLASHALSGTVLSAMSVVLKHFQPYKLLANGLLVLISGKDSDARVRNSIFTHMYTYTHVTKKCKLPLTTVYSWSINNKLIFYARMLIFHYNQTNIMFQRTLSYRKPNYNVLMRHFLTCCSISSTTPSSRVILFGNQITLHMKVVFKTLSCFVTIEIRNIINITLVLHP